MKVDQCQPHENFYTVCQSSQVVNWVKTKPKLKKKNIFPLEEPDLASLQMYTAGIGTHVKSVKVTSICHRYYHVKV